MRIMFVMLKTMGDVLVGTTICRELKKEFPEGEIHFYTNSFYSELLENNPDIAEIHKAEEWTHDKIFMEMAFNGYDRVYAPYQARGECNMWHQFEETRHQHLVDFYWRRMGMHRLITERECYLSPSALNFESFDRLLDPPNSKPVIAMHSTSGVPTKDWPLFDELTEALRGDSRTIVQVGARGDKIINGAIDLRGRMGFMDLAGFLSRCSAFVGLDSGVSYMADAMRVPTIVIQGSTDPVTSGPISGRVIHLFAEKTGYEDCQNVRCHVNCRHEVNCNTKITPNMVLEALTSALEK